MAIPPVPGKKLTRAHSAPKRTPQHSAKRTAAAKKKAASAQKAANAKKATTTRTATTARKAPARKVPVTPQPVAPRPVTNPKHHAHRGLHRLLIGLNIFVAVCVVAVGGTYGYLKFRFGQLDKLEFGCTVLRNCGDDDPGKPMNVLLVGNDTRANISKSEQAKFGTQADVGGQRTDTMMVLHIDPLQEKASILSIPRDLWVPIAGTRTTDRINTAYGVKTTGRSAGTTVGRNSITTTNALGQPVTTSSVPIKDGPERLIATIRHSLGIEIDHYIEVDFVGFREIVSAVGGVTVPFPAPARDRLAGLDVKQAGCVKLDGDQALAYVRSRHFQYYESGRWRSDPTGDIGRIQRQQDFIRRVLRQAISKGIRNPIKANALIGAGVNNVKLDSALSTKDIARLGTRFKSLEPEAVDMLTLPTENFRTSAGASVLRLKKSEARDIIDRFNGIGQQPTNGPVPKIPPATVRVLVLNGTGVNGQAGEVQRALIAAGFGSGGVGGVPGYGKTTTEIRYGAGQLQKAQLLAAYVIGPSRMILDNTLKGGDIQLITGATYGGVRTSLSTTPTSASPTTTTTPKSTGTQSRSSALAC